MRLSVSDLRLFVNVVEAGSITHGAARSNLAVASASARIRDMEYTTGCPLLVRKRLGVTLTEGGRTLLHHARVLLRQDEAMREELAEYGKRHRGRVRLFSVTTALLEFLADPLCSFLRAHPRLNLEIEEHFSHDVLRAVADGSADLGIVAFNDGAEACELIPYRVERLVVVAADPGPLSDVGQARFADLTGYEFVGLGRDTALQRLVENHARLIGARLSQRVQVLNFETVFQLVAAGIGISIVPEAVARRLSRTAAVRYAALSDEWAQLSLTICVKNRIDLPPAPAALLKHLVPC